MKPILAVDLKTQYKNLQTEIDAAVARVLESGIFILDREVRAFETEFASYCGCQYGMGVSSGTAALHLALRAGGIGPGDEVVTVSHTAVATVAAIDLCGARRCWWISTRSAIPWPRSVSKLRSRPARGR